MSIIDQVINLNHLRLGLQTYLVDNSPIAAALDAAGKATGENIDFEPPDDLSMWMSTVLIPTTERQPAFKLVQSTGRFLVSANVLRGSAPDVAEELRFEVCQAFRPGTQPDFVPPGQNKINVDRAERLGAVNIGSIGSKQEAWVSFAVDVTWRIYAT